MLDSLKCAYGHRPDEDGGEKWAIYEDSLVITHPDRQPRLYKNGCAGMFTVLEPSDIIALMKEHRPLAAGALHRALKAGAGVIANANIGYGIKVSDAEGGRIAIEVNPSPDGAERVDFKALRDFMEETAVEWLRQVAPHRLALGADER